MSTLAEQLRQSVNEVRVLIERQGVGERAAVRALGSLADALERGSVGAREGSADRRIVGDSVFSWIEHRGLLATPRELRILHNWVVAGLTARIEELAAAQQLAASVEERFRFILPNARIRVVELDCDLRIRWMYDPGHFDKSDEVIGLSIREIGASTFVEELVTVVERVIRTGVGERAELSPPTVDQPEYLLASFEPIRSEDGTISRVLVAATVVTELKQAEFALAQSVSFREQMLAVLAHDLKNPLTSVLALARLYARNEQLPANARRALAQIDAASERMVELIVTLLDFSAARFGRALPVTRVACDLDETLRSVIEELQGGAPQREIALHIEGDTSGAWDRPRMAQLLSNLVGNALAYGAPLEPIVVQVEGLPGRVLICVQNRGPVIAPEAMPRLFDPFHRGGDPDARPRGLGLGLYIVQEIVKAHGGAIHVDSSVAQGTVFTVDLPRQG